MSTAELVFYEKPGCVGNGMQKSLLRSLGIRFEVRDLLSHPWTAELLRAYFGKTPVTEWFNNSAPSVKSGEIAIDSLTEAQALDLMLLDPILIRRPLLELGSLMQSGFVAGPVLDALGVELDASQNLQDCPMDAAQADCAVDELKRKT
ncbi:MAG: ArsC/Spx/MgsR family protein [Candidatus Thiodiazotropha sp.]|jgi:nitrogenase-associated protein